MIRMERIGAWDTRRIQYRGTLSLGNELEFDPLRIQADAVVETPHGYTPEADEQCVRAIANKIALQVKKHILRRLSMRVNTYSYDNTDLNEEWILLNYDCRREHAYVIHTIKAQKGSRTLEMEFPAHHENDLNLIGIISEHVFYPDRIPEYIRRIARITISIAPEYPRYIELHPRCRSQVNVTTGRLRDTQMNTGNGRQGRVRTDDRADAAAFAMRQIAPGEQVRIRPYETRVFMRPEEVYGESVAETLSRRIQERALNMPVVDDIEIIFKPCRPERDTPERRAMSLLARKIGKAKYRNLKKLGYFEEQGIYGTYRFHKNKEGGVTFIQKIKVGGLKERPVMWDLCIQSQASDLPPGDVILSRWLNMKADEDNFLETANFRKIRTMDEAHERPLNVNLDARVNIPLFIRDYWQMMQGVLNLNPRA